MKIPKESKKVFSGVIFDVYQWEQKMFDGRTETFERLSRADTVQVIPVVDNKIVYVSEEQPASGEYLGLVGGRVDPEEKPFDCAKRELMEETGMESTDWSDFYRFSPVSKIRWDVFFYVARDCKIVADPHLDGGEKIDIRYATFDEFIDVVTTEGFRASELTLHVLRHHKNGTLDELKKQIFGN